LAVTKLTIIALRTLAARHGLAGIGGVVTARLFPGTGVTAAAAIAVNTCFNTIAPIIVLTLKMFIAGFLRLAGAKRCVTNRIT
jgi:hypothetical protein